jgi:hypothetical protein
MNIYTWNNHIGGVMVRVLASSVADRGFDCKLNVITGMRIITIQKHK